MLTGPDGILKSINWRSYLWLLLVFVVTIVLGVVLFWIFTKISFLKQSTILVPLTSFVTAAIMLMTVFAWVNRRQKQEWALAENNQDVFSQTLEHEIKEATEIVEDGAEERFTRFVGGSNKLQRKLSAIRFNATAQERLKKMSESYSNSLLGLSRLIAYHQNGEVVFPEHVEAAKQALEVKKRNWRLQLGAAIGGALLGAFPEGVVNAMSANDINNVIIFMFLGCVGIVVVLVGILKS